MIAAVRTSLTQERPLGGRGVLVAAVVVVAGSAVAVAMPEGAAARWLLAGVLAAVLAFVCLRSTRQGVLLAFVWLLFVGLSRRVASEALADPAKDPLLLVVVGALTVLGLRALLAGALRRLTVLSYAMLAFTALAVVEVLNPDQPSGLGRFTGLLIWVLPTLWFWVGRSIVDDRLARQLVLAVGGISLLICLYGLAQFLVGLPPWDQRWIDHRGYAALYIGPTTVRPFGTFSSASEFALACAVAAVVSATLLLQPSLLVRVVESVRARRRVRVQKRWLAIFGLVGLLVAGLALALSGVRTYLVLLIVALPVLLVLLWGKRSWKVLVPVLLVGAVVVVALSQIDPDDLERDGAQAALRRIVLTVNDPFASNQADNTLQIHYENAKAGVEEGFDHPLGHGTSATGIRGEQLEQRYGSTDFDISDAAVSFGIPGLVVTLAIVVLAFVTALRVAIRRRTFEHVVLVGVLIVSIGAWFQGGHYAMAAFLWLLVGRADGVLSHRRTTRVIEPAGDAEPPTPAEDALAPAT
jgi:cell division protein FtsW (lipid II flippase)